jgi:hypothetical protein
MAGRFELLLDGNREQRPSKTEFVAVAAHEAMMKNGGGMMGRGMRGTMYDPQHQH